jgi:glycerate 2-kinase
LASLKDHRRDLDRIVRSALDAIDPRVLLERAAARRAFDHVAGRRLFVVSAGKAAWPMAAAFERLARGRVRAGLVAAPGAGSEPLPTGFEWFPSSHPFPNDSSVAAGRRSLGLAREVEDGEALVVLLSGGASAMLVDPVPGVTLEDKVVTSRRLMEAGVAIDGLNCVRKHLSRVKGGHLGALSPRTLTLAISDVHAPIPDDPSVIGSGPTIADPTTFADAARVVSEARVRVPESVGAYLELGARERAPETIKPGDPRLSHAAFEIIGSRHDAVDGARRAAERAGYDVEVVRDGTHGEARSASLEFLNVARRLAASASRPLCVLGSGETTVRVTGGGLGGRNQEFALSAAAAITEFGDDVLLASIGTDGADGPTDAAGAVVDTSTLERAARTGVEWKAHLAANDAYHFFEPLGDLLITGPTGTNVGDLHVVLLG